jgi:hypothetical protein
MRKMKKLQEVPRWKKMLGKNWAGTALKDHISA